jgi:hypothetical protein
MIDLTDKIKSIALRYDESDYFLSVDELKNERHTYIQVINAKESRSGDEIVSQKTGKLSKIESENYLPHIAEGRPGVKVSVKSAMGIEYTFNGFLFYRTPDESCIYLPDVNGIE